MTISELIPGAPTWLQAATTVDADVTYEDDDCTRIVWRGGEWHGGEWHDGEWRGGVWRSGVWHDGMWHGGEWHGGEWHGGVWRDGVWYGGEWCRGTWRDGMWHGGAWHSGAWYNGVWHGGEWRDGEWHFGVWRGGVWHGGVWHGGVWHGGEWRGQEDRLRYFLAVAGLPVLDGDHVIGYRTTTAQGQGRFTKGFEQPEGRYFEANLPGPTTGTCVPGIHIANAARAWYYFGVDPTCQFWWVDVALADIIACDGEKARIRGGHFIKIARPF